ncbi:MAG TPA: hypothetical protein VE981_14840 [Planctomycetota bacterium]|nr:hypothetical protein [Planctomycetota bacterium]
MKSKSGSLYEVLKSASRPSGDAGAPSAPDTTPVGDGNQGTLQERLAAYKAAKLAAAQSVSVESRPEPPAPKVSATTLVLEPDPTPPPMPVATRMERSAPAASAIVVDTEPEAPARPGLGERSMTVTWNTLLFGGMIAVGLLFIAYAVGLHVGKAAALTAVPAAPEAARPSAPLPPPVRAVAPPPVFAAPPAPRKEFTIRLCEMKTTSSQERLKALAFAEDADLKKALERAGHRGFEKAFINRGSEVRMALYVDRFADNNSDAAKAALTAMKNFRFKNQTPFAQAAFEEVQPR